MDESDRTAGVSKDIILGYDDGDVRFSLPWVDQVEEPLAGLIQSGMPIISNLKLALSDYQPTIDQPAFGLFVLPQDSPQGSVPVSSSPSGHDFQPNTNLERSKVLFPAVTTRPLSPSPADYHSQPTNVQPPPSSSSSSSAISSEYPPENWYATQSTFPPAYYYPSQYPHNIHPHHHHDTNLDTPSSASGPFNLQTVFPTPVSQSQPEDPHGVNTESSSDLHHQQPDVCLNSPTSPLRSIHSRSSTSNVTENELVSPIDQPNWVPISRPPPVSQPGPSRPTPLAQSSYRTSSELPSMTAAKQPRLSHISPNCNKDPGQVRRTMIACERCRLHKLRCLGGTPCGACERRGLGNACAYVTEVRRRGKGKKKASSTLKEVHADTEFFKSHKPRAESGKGRTTAKSLSSSHTVVEPSGASAEPSFTVSTETHRSRPPLLSQTESFIRPRFPSISSFVSPSSPALADDTRRGSLSSDPSSIPAFPLLSNESARYPSVPLSMGDPARYPAVPVSLPSSSTSSFNGPSFWAPSGTSQAELFELLPPGSPSPIIDSHRTGAHSQSMSIGSVHSDQQRSPPSAILSMAMTIPMAGMTLSTGLAQPALNAEQHNRLAEVGISSGFGQGNRDGLSTGHNRSNWPSKQER